jgi:hypothetical protein
LRSAFLTFVLALLIAPAAQAATPFALGPGEDPGLAVDGAGTAYIAWNGTENTGTRSLHFCRLPRGATTCQGAATLTEAPFFTLYRPFVTVSGSTVRVVQTRYGFLTGEFTRVYLFTSTDGGNTFDAGTVVGGITFQEALAGPGNTISAVSFATTGGGIFQSMPAAQNSQASANLSDTHLYEGAVGLTPQGRLITVFNDNAGDSQLRLQSGAGDPNDAATWGPPVSIGTQYYAKLAGGPAGLFLLGQNADRDLTVRRFTGTTFGTPARAGTGNEAPQAGFSQDGGGRLHAVFPTFETNGVALNYAASDDGVNWLSSVLTTQSDGEEMDTRVATAPDHTGLAVWETATQIRAIAVSAPVPVYGKTVVVKRISGTVRVRRPGAKKFVDLSAAGSVPLGASVDARHGRLALSALPSRTARVQTVQLYQGQFKVTRSGRFTQFALNEPLARCRAGASAAALKPKTRRLWGDGKGAFRTRGRYSAATVRGTRWLVQDSCAGTLTRVAQGSVNVRDSVRRKTIIVRAGKRYLAKPRRR